MTHNTHKHSVLAQFRADPVAFLRELAEAGSDTAQFRIGSRNLTLLKDAGQIEEVLVKKQNSFCKGPGLLRLRPLIGDGLLTADNKRHKEARRVLQPAFSLPKIAEYGAAMPNIFQQLTEGWASGKVVDIMGEMSRLTLAIIGATAFRSSNYPDHKAVGAAISENLDTLFRPLSRCPEAQLGKPSSAELLDTVLKSVHDGHIASPEGDDLFSLLCSGEFSEQEQRDQAITFLLGGHESVAVSLTWTWYALSQNPQIREKFEQEIDSLDAENLSVSDLPYTRQIVAESLRLYPPAWMFSREATEDVTIGGSTYAKGSIIVVAPIVTHRDPRYWPSPELFDPSRWNSSQFTLSATPRFSFFPFGGGARRCIGEQFALAELPLALATIGKKWHLDQPAAAHVPQFDPVVTLRPVGGLPMTLTSRLPAQQPCGQS